MSETAFHYDTRRVSHRVGTGTVVSVVALLVVLFLPDVPTLFRALLAVGVVGVGLHTMRFQRLRVRQGPALMLRDEGLDVAAWGLGVVPWSEIEGARLVARNNIAVKLKHPQKWEQRMSLGERVLTVLGAVFGAGRFTIDGGLLQVRPDALLAQIQARLRDPQ